MPQVVGAGFRAHHFYKDIGNPTPTYFISNFLEFKYFSDIDVIQTHLNTEIDSWFTLKRF
jgi:hypothetical protein